MTKILVGVAASLLAAILLLFKAPLSQAADELLLTYTKPECSTTVRKGRT